MAIGKLISTGISTGLKAFKASRKARAVIPKRIGPSPSLGTIPRGGSRSGVESAGVVKNIARSKKVNALQNAAAAAGLAGIVGGAIYGGGKTKKATPVVPSAKKKPSTPSRHTSKITKPPAGLKKATRPTAKKKPVKKPVRMASVPTVRNRRTPAGGPKTQVEVGSSIIRNRDGSIKKVNKPTGAKKKSKYASMSRMKIAKLGGMEKRAYKKWKASQGK